ncbi:lysylphosphatidylglycerol synthase transmembrane domain-containing protein [Proteinivorax tanatarense]|uniref:Phosphatidylglycerol lysyltransferase n=1 Tax=Proteinivorax tanatarense TaxID=1260629 RepID=A0AAU7VKZ0_9FIRM
MENRRKWVIISVAIGIIVNGVILYRYFDESTFHSLARIDKSLILVLFLVALTGVLLESMRIKLLTSQLQINLSLSDGAKIHLITAFGGYSTPMNAGDAPIFMFWGLCKKIKINKWFSILMIKNFLTKLAFLSFFVTSILLCNFTDTDVIGQVIFKIAAISIIPSTIFSIIVIYNFKFVEKVLCLMPKKIKDKWGNNSSLTMKKAMTHKVWIAYIFTVLYWLVYFCPPLIIAIKMDLQINLLQLYIKQFLIYTTLPFSPMPGGSGVVELIYLSLFKNHVPAGELVVFILLCRMVTYYVPLIVGGVIATKELK